MPVLRKRITRAVNSFAVYYFTCPSCGQFSGPFKDDEAQVCQSFFCHMADNHKHVWKIYKGLNVVEKYCTCGEKQSVDWKEVAKYDKD
jgi:hypothetical protein